MTLRILIVARWKESFPMHVAPFVYEQGEALTALGCIVDILPFHSHYFDAKSIRTKIKDFNPDIIHAHYGLCGIPALLQSKVPLVVTFHNGETLNFGVNFISSLFSLKAKHVIYVAKHVYNKCIFKRAINYSIIPCGVNLDECVITPKEQARAQLNFLPDRKYVLFGGAFDNLRKNYPLLREAITKIKRNDISVIEMKGMSREQISLYLSACDLFALPTKSEGSPQALKEAMACNCPILATDVADIKYLLGRIPGHYICKNDINDVSAKLSTALNHNSRTKGRERIINLNLTNIEIAKRLISIYQGIIRV